ncbi:MAG: hypothetical protein AAGG66_07025 [Methanothrix soehngenii]|jgi:hypothetical protein|uniref:hypothetical protein n=1 Tax=Methanothrix soehngenii TaxID=2223 RepID=UPI003142C0B6
MLEGVNGGLKVSNSGEIKLSTCQSLELKPRVMQMIDVEEFLMSRSTEPAQDSPATTHINHRLASPLSGQGG